jgi:hypothetical protein
MKDLPLLHLCLRFLLPSTLVVSSGFGAPIQTLIQSQSGQVGVGWVAPDASLPNSLELRVQRSADLKSWQNVGAKTRLPIGAPASGIAFQESVSQLGFYRLLLSDSVQFAGSNGEETLGYAGALADELALARHLSLGDFSARYSPAEPYWPVLTWNPTNALYWSQYNSNHPPLFRAGGSIPGMNVTLSAHEFSTLSRNGFLVLERLSDQSFADIYYRIFLRDLPVFISADSILHAWHRSFDAILEDMEQNRFRPTLKTVLDGMADHITASSQQLTGVMHEGLVDADYFLAVARELLTAGSGTSHLGNEARIADTLNRIRANYVGYFTWFWGTEFSDFSFFKPRGHYTRTPDLSTYFQSMTWCGKAGMIVAGTNSSARQVATALVLLDLLKKSGNRELLGQLDGVLAGLIGPADSLGFGQLDALAEAAGLDDLSHPISSVQLLAFATQLENGGFGFQNVAPIGLPETGHVADQRLVPRLFSVMGQRFTLDAWALQEMVWPRITPERTGSVGDIRRRRPYCLDSAFAALGNSQVVPDLIANIANAAGEPFRDGFPYQHKLAAVRSVIDQQPTATWEATIYSRWLRALRALSAPTTGPEYPEAMRTRSWAMKNLNTQLASWMQLRHDSILYVKQSQTPPWLCYYPDAYVEPRPEFFQRVSEMAEHLGRLTATLGTNWNGPGTMAGLQTFLSRFSTNCQILKGIALKELAQQPRSPEENLFLGDLIEIMISYFGERQFNGWYPRMFYRGAEGTRACVPQPGFICPDHDSSLEDYIVTDVHTDGPSVPDGDPGGVLHEAVGRVNFMMIAVDNGPDRVIYAGPVFSHYEFWKPYGTRLTDDQWRAQVQSLTNNPAALPPPPPWTQSYLIRR